MDNERTPRRGHPWLAWAVAVRLFWPLIQVLMGYATLGTQKYPAALRIVIASIALAGGVSAMAVACQPDEANGRQQPAVREVATATPKPTPTPKPPGIGVSRQVVVAVTSTPDEESGRQQLEVREVATATPKPTPTPKSPGIGVSRQSVQSTLEEFDFTFDQPRLMRDGEWIVDGRTSQGRGIVSLVGPADELNRAYILIAGGQTIDFIDAGIFLAVVAPGFKDEAATWMENNADEAVRWEGVSTTHQGVKITMDVTLELGWFELTVEPE